MHKVGLILLLFAAPVFPDQLHAQSLRRQGALDALQQEPVPAGVGLLEQKSQALLSEEAQLLQRVENIRAKLRDQKPGEPIAADGDAGSLLQPAPRDASSQTSEVAALQEQLGASQERIAQLLAALDESRRQLMMAETEVERLSAIIEGRNPSRRARQASTVTLVPPPAMRIAEAPAPKPTVAAPVAQQLETPEGEMPIVTVTAEKANLRTGPGKNNSPLMSVSEGTRLAVETRSGDWYRVITPTGARAWVSSEVIAFGPQVAPPSPQQLVAAVPPQVQSVSEPGQSPRQVLAPREPVIRQVRNKSDDKSSEQAALDLILRGMD